MISSFELREFIMELKLTIPLFLYVIISIYFIYNSNINNKIALFLVSAFSLALFSILSLFYYNEFYIFNNEKNTTYLVVLNLIINSLFFNFLLYKKENFIFKIEEFIDKNGNIFAFLNFLAPMIISIIYITIIEDSKISLKILLYPALTFAHSFILLYLCNILDDIFCYKISSKKINILFKNLNNTISTENLNFLNNNFEIRHNIFNELYRHKNLNFYFYDKFKNDKPLFIAFIKNTESEILFKNNYWLDILFNRKEILFKDVQLEDVDLLLPSEDNYKYFMLKDIIDFNSDYLPDIFYQKLKLLNLVNY